MSVTLHSAFEPAQIVFSEVVKTAKGQKQVYINDANKQKIRIQTPIMRCPFGLNTFSDANTGANSLSLDLSFGGDSPKLNEFLAKCRAIDDAVIGVVEKNSVELFGKQLSRDILSEFHRPCVRDPSDPKYAPTLRLKVSGWSEVYDEQQQRVDNEALVKGATVRAIIEPFFWTVNKSFGVSLRISQIAIVSRPAGLDGFSFVEEDTEGIGNDENAMPGQAFV
jgi:hypothetical protein